MLPTIRESHTYYASRSGNIQLYLYRRKPKKEQKIKRKQKILGLTAVMISAIELLAGYMGIIDEGGAFIIMLPIGIYILFTKNKML